MENAKREETWERMTREERLVLLKAHVLLQPAAAGDLSEAGAARATLQATAAAAAETAAAEVAAAETAAAEAAAA